MFAPRTRPLALDAERLVGLRLSLNSPVVATPELPTGPARAAIVAHLEGGLRRLTVAVRSLRNGASVLYELEGEDLETTMDFSVAQDAALSFAESMGFLFDDDEFDKSGDGQVQRALARWREIIGATSVASDDTERGSDRRLPSAAATPAQPDAPPATASTPSHAAGASVAELLLDELADDAPAAPSFESAPACAPDDPAAALVPLTKFRVQDGADAPPTAQDPAATALGRVRLVRRRHGEAPPHTSPLLRLLACF